MRLPLPTFALTLTALAAALASSCTTNNPLFCDAEDTCGPGLQCDLIRKECVPPEDVSVECEQSAQCLELDEPICDEVIGICRECADGDDGDAECRALGAGANLCVDGACVECAESSDCAAGSPACSAEGTCERCEISEAGDAACASRDDGALPVCGAAGQCVECRSNSDCASTLCDAVAGECLAPEAVVFAAPNGTDSADCGDFDGTPCATLSGAQGALEKLDAEADRIYLRLAPGIYEENATIADTTVIVLGDGADLKSSADDVPVISITNSNVELRGLTVRNATTATTGTNAVGILCSGRRLSLNGASVKGNAGRGIEASGCDVSIVDSDIADNDRGGVRVMNAGLALVSSFVRDNSDAGVVTLDAPTVFIVNNFITRNGTPGSRTGAVDINTSDSTMPSVFSFNTIVDNQSLTRAEDGAIVRCLSDAITSDHNIIYLNETGEDSDPPLVGTCVPAFSNIENANEVNDNINQPPTFVDRGAGDYHLAAGSAGVDQGAETSDITVDFDGDVRPQGTRLDIGADERAPSALQSLPRR